MQITGLVLVGLAAGVASGMFGLGGGVIIVPALLWIFKMRELDAIATSLAALIPPVGLLGAWEHYRNGHVNLKFSAAIACGLFAGAWFGAKMVTGLSPVTIQRLYGSFLVAVGARMLLFGR